jgi:hypothetical protein
MGLMTNHFLPARDGLPLKLRNEPKASHLGVPEGLPFNPCQKITKRTQDLGGSAIDQAAFFAVPCGSITNFLAAPLSKSL